MLSKERQRTRRGERRYLQLPVKLQENRRYWNLRDIAVDRTLWSLSFGKCHENT